MRCFLGRVVVVIAATAALSEGVSAKEVHDALQADITPYLETLQKRGKPSFEYLVEKCKRHDLVLIGEEHRIRENCEFIAAALEPVYRQAGVRVLATEFLRTSNTDRARELVEGPTFDRELAIDLMRDNAWPTWGYVEYLGILKAAWRLNASLPTDAERLRVVPLDSGWSQHDLFYKRMSARDRFKLMRDRERHMARVLSEEVLSSGQHAIAHVGFQHSLLTQGERLGVLLFREHNQRVTQVCLHQKMAGRHGASTVSKLIDRAFRAYGAEPVGFDVENTPFAELRDPHSPAFTFGGDRSLDELAKGYIVLAPLDELRPVRWIDGFITEDNFKEALEVAVKMRQAKKSRETTPEKLNARMKQVWASR